MRKGGKLEVWKVEKLGDVCDIVNGSTPLRSNKSFWENGNISWFTIDDIRTQGRKITETKQKVTQTALEESSLRMLPINAVLLCCTASIGEYAITEIPLATNQQFNGLVVKNQKLLSPYFLFHYCATLKDKLLNLSGKTTIDFIPISRLRELEIPVPPLPEQQRIVSVLDEAFASIAQAKSNAERNLVNARELFESLVERLFENTGKGWKTEKLKKITTKIGSGATPRGGGDSYQAEGLSLIRSLNVHDMGFRMKKLAFLDDEQADKLSNVAVESGDVLLNITGASIARCCIVPDDVLPARVNQHVSIIRLVKDEMIPEFLHYALISKTNKDKLLNTGEKGGATRQALTKAQIEDFSVSYPPLAEQRAIVGRLEALSAETGRLEEIYEAKVEGLEELKRSVLGKAFGGEL